MCGIIGYIGEKQAYPILINALKRLEYRGYDSSGIALFGEDMHVYKRKGKVQDLVNYAKDKNISGTIGIGHTRWATHGKPDDINAHPHISGNGRLSLIHNGIIENYDVIKKALIREGHEFKSQTDTEVLVHLIEAIQTRDSLALEEAVRVALTKVVGAYAIVVMDKTNPDKLVVARKASPLVIGIGENEFFIASDPTPIIEHTKKVVFLNDEETGVVTRDGNLTIKTIANEIQTPFVQQLELKIEMMEKGDYEHFMLKEIHEQPTSIRNCMAGRVNAAEGWIKVGGAESVEDRIFNAKRFIVAACGTSWHAGLIGEYLSLIHI